MKRRHVFLLFAFIGMSLFVQLRSNAQRGSTYTAHPHGAKAFLLLLESMDVDVEPWLLPYDRLPLDESGGTLFVISPASSGAEEKLVEWVEKGNRLVLLAGVSSATLTLLQKLGLYGADKKPELFENVELISSNDLAISCSGQAACENVKRISIPSEFFTGQLSQFERLDGGTERSRVLHRTLGKGDVWLISGEEPVLNRNIDTLDNIRFLYQLATEGDHVYIDEFHHGYTAPAAVALQSKHTAVVLLMCFLVFAVAVGALSRAIRFGPPLEELQENPAGMVEFASVLGLLCEEHRATSVLRHYLDAWKGRIEMLFGVSRKLQGQETIAELVRRGHLPQGKENELSQAVAVLMDGSSKSPQRAANAVRTLEQIL